MAATSGGKPIIRHRVKKCPKFTSGAVNSLVIPMAVGDGRIMAGG